MQKKKAETERKAMFDPFYDLILNHVALFFWGEFKVKHCSNMFETRIPRMNKSKFCRVESESTVHIGSIMNSKNDAAAGAEWR